MERIEKTWKEIEKKLKRIVRKNGKNWKDLKRIEKKLKRIVRENGKNWK